MELASAGFTFGRFGPSSREDIGETVDTIHMGIMLAEEAVRDIQREALTDRAGAARLALAEGMDTWSRGDISEALWPDVLGAASSQLIAIIAAY